MQQGRSRHRRRSEVTTLITDPVDRTDPSHSDDRSDTLPDPDRYTVGVAQIQTRRNECVVESPVPASKTEPEDQIASLQPGYVARS